MCIRSMVEVLHTHQTETAPRHHTCVSLHVHCICCLCLLKSCGLMHVFMQGPTLSLWGLTSPTRGLLIRQARGASLLGRQPQAHRAQPVQASLQMQWHPAAAAALCTHRYCPMFFYLPHVQYALCARALCDVTPYGYVILLVSIKFGCKGQVI